MRYKRYVAKISFDSDSHVYHGEIVNLRDIVTFQCESLGGLEEQMKISVEVYLEFCNETKSE